MKLALYTAIYGGYETAKPVPQNLGVPAILYTDNPNIYAPGWEVRVVRHGITSLKGDLSIVAPMLAHKFWKCHPHLAVPDADITMWVDGSMEIVVDDYVDRCLASLNEDEWSCVRHPVRSCIFPEGEYSATLTWRYDAASILEQIEFYRTIGHRPGFGLIATGANVRRHTDQAIEIGEQWWHECITRSHQDQLSLPVLFGLHPGFRWNMNLSWHTDWILHPHG